MEHNSCQLIRGMGILVIRALQFEQIPEQFRYNLKYQITYSPGDKTPTSFILNPIDNGLEEIAFGFTNSSNATVLTDNATGGTFTWTVDPTISAGNAYEMIATQSGGGMALYSTITVGSLAASTTSSPTDTVQVASTSVTSTSSPTGAESSTTPTQDSNPSSQGLSAGAKAGIGVGTTLGVALLGLGAFLLGRKIRSNRSEGPYHDVSKAEMDGSGLEKYRYATEIGQPGPSELGAESAPGELGTHVDKAEQKLARDELLAEPRSPQELPA
ncbi:hypothetical protein BDV96DRAFT_606139 [Lophiotrema nucula]|uniref:Ser-Thr-rich glycosyl-phosphatidyl-inositol-anchored membrane family-domain-containing protein n=1 Tax=Lophiotrema nucula TaxID=690887 RepID=A0A6A5YND3_9PLEO|nr:hypothetical protein BDV96DRAFT_606139 [Lophiotrema nucula]